ncbi:MAG: nucleoside deaminase [Pseudomonadota bacterium]
MNAAIEQARLAAGRGEVPVGAAILDAEGQIIAVAGNRVRAGLDPTAHAELGAIRQACQKLHQPRLDDCTMIVTLEPCAMCAGAIHHARIKRLCFGAEDPKGGHIINGMRYFAQAGAVHRPEIIHGIREAECAQLLKEFFHTRRASYKT